MMEHDPEAIRKELAAKTKAELCEDLRYAARICLMPTQYSGLPAPSPDFLKTISELMIEAAHRLEVFLEIEDGS